MVVRGSSLLVLAWLAMGCLEAHRDRPLAPGRSERDASGLADAGPIDDSGALDPDYAARQARSRLDPNAVYLAGTLTEGSCGRTAIAKVESPNEALVGFGCLDRPGIIDPATGHLLYWTNSGQLREFQCDNGCAFWSDDDTYPYDPARNDPEVSLSVCSDGKEAKAIRIAPDGFRLFRCGEIEWHDENGALVYLGDLDELGPGLIGLVRSDAIDLMSGRPLGRFPGKPESARATETGFLALITKTTIEDHLGLPELWELSLDGHVEKLGSFPPAAQDEARIIGGILDGAGRLYMQSTSDSGRTDIVERLTITGEREIVYTEADDPVVKLHADYLVTGP